MALRAGYYGIKRGLKAKLAEIAGAWDETVSSIFPRDEQAVLGAKNQFDGTKGSIDNGGLTGAIVNADGSVTVPSGTTSGFFLYPNSSSYDKCYIVKPNTSYKFSIGYKSSNVYLSVNYKANSGDSWHLITEKNNVSEIEFTTPSTIYAVWIRFTITQNIAFEGATFYPMLRFATDPDDTYVPYAMTNRELTVSVQTDETTLSDHKTTINAIITAATGAADFAAFKAAMEAITPVTRSLSREASPEDVPEEVIEEPVVKKTTKKKTVKEGE